MQRSLLLLLGLVCLSQAVVTRTLYTGSTTCGGTGTSTEILGGDCVADGGTYGQFTCLRASCGTGSILHVDKQGFADSACDGNTGTGATGYEPDKCYSQGANSVKFSCTNPAGVVGNYPVACCTSAQLACDTKNSQSTCEADAGCEWCAGNATYVDTRYTFTTCAPRARCVNTEKLLHIGGGCPMRMCSWAAEVCFYRTAAQCESSYVPTWNMGGKCHSCTEWRGQSDCAYDPVTKCSVTEPNRETNYGGGTPDVGKCPSVTDKTVRGAAFATSAASAAVIGVLAVLAVFFN